jgi:CheY-like chemotaxis protein
MEVRALVISSDSNTSSMVRRSLNSVGVTPDEGVKVEEAMLRVRRLRYEAIVVDLSVAGGRELLSDLRADASTRCSVLFAIAGGKGSMRDAFQLGATFVLEKPLSLDRSLRCFRAAYGLIIGERRRYYRHKVTLPVTILRDGGEQSSGYSVDLSAGGMLMEVATPLPENVSVKIQFGIPGTGEKAAVACEVIWSRNGRAGLRFLRYSRNSKETLLNWISTQMEREMGTNGPVVTDMKLPATM